MLLIAFALFNCSFLIAQPENKTFVTQTIPVSIYQVFCGVESATGTITREWKITVPGQWFQLKITYSYIGDDSGCHYEGHLVRNVHFKIPPSGVITESYNQAFFMKRDNVPIGIIHYSWHFTVNANGEVAVYHENQFEECFESQ